MNKIVSLALVATVLGGLFATAPAFAKDTELCGPNGPEAYNRPGGYCDQIKDKTSLSRNEHEHRWGFTDL